MSELEPYTYDAHGGKDMHKIVAGIVRGRVNWVGEVTLEESATSTTVEDDRLTEDSEISLSPLSAASAAIVTKVSVGTLTPGHPWGGVVGAFVLDHPNLTGTYEFRYSIKG